MNPLCKVGVVISTMLLILMVSTAADAHGARPYRTAPSEYDEVHGHATEWQQGGVFQLFDSGPKVRTYQDGCVWVPQHRDRVGHVIQAHLAC